jgi:hypothetical protein
MFLKIQKAAVRVNYEAGNQAFSMRLRFLTISFGILWADLEMISGMHVQKTDIIDILARGRRLGRRTMVGAPSSEPEALLILDDHVVVGEPDEVFDRIATDLETGLARRLYLIHKKPDVSKTPAPRFDLLKLGNYVLMSVQFSRGCPFQCEFCNIITLFGRKPRTKRPNQLVAELQASVDLGWRKPVFVVYDNFIGNHKLALALVQEMEAWQKARDYPLLFFTEALIDLKPELIEAMVKANFFVVFIGIESPSKESLKEAKKFQNLRQDSLQSIRFIQSKGLWVLRYRGHLRTAEGLCWSFNPPKLSLGFTILLSGHRFISYARNAVAQLESALAIQLRCCYHQLNFTRCDIE